MNNKWFFDLLPVIVFFVAYKFADIYIATGLAIAINVLQIAWQLIRKQHIGTMQWLGLAIIVIFGGMTLALRDEAFIKWKPSILYWCFAGGLIISTLMSKNPLKALMGGQISLPDPIWKKLTHIWTAFFASMGVLNLVVAYQFSTDAWVNFKLFGTTGLTVAFIFAQGFYLSSHIREEEQEETPRETKS